MFTVSSIIKLGIVMLIVCACIVVLCYVAHNKEENEEQDCNRCNGDCNACGKLPKQE